MSVDKTLPLSRGRGWPHKTKLVGWPYPFAFYGDSGNHDRQPIDSLYIKHSNLGNGVDLDAINCNDFKVFKFIP